MNVVVNNMATSNYSLSQALFGVELFDKKGFPTIEYYNQLYKQQPIAAPEMKKQIDELVELSKEEYTIPTFGSTDMIYCGIHNSLSNGKCKDCG